MKFIQALCLVCILAIKTSTAFAQAAVELPHPGQQWRALLIAKDYVALQASIKALHEETLANDSKRRELRRALGYLVDSGAKTAPQFDEFAKLSPQTYGAMVRGYFLVHQAWVARGNKFASKTSGEQFARMRQLMASAITDFEAAVKGLNQRCDPCYSGLINVGMALGRKELKAQAINDSVRFDGGGFEAPLAYLSSIDPSWGGSFDGMQQYVDEFAKQFPQSFTTPVLKASLLVTQAQDYIDNAQSDRAQLLVEQAIKIDPASATAWSKLATVMQNAKQYDAVIDAASRALTIDPALTHTRNSRAHAYLNSKTPLQAVPDLEYAVTQGDEWALKAVLPILAAGQYGFTPDKQRAKVVCQTAMESLMASGFTCMGGLHYFGLNGPANHVEARKWFVEGANRGSPQAMVDVGVMMWRGQGGSVQAEEAVKYWLMGKAAGEPRADVQLRSNLSQFEYLRKVTMPQKLASMSEYWASVSQYIDAFTQDWQVRLRALIYVLTGK